MAQLVKPQSIYLPLEEDRIVILLLDKKWDVIDDWTFMGLSGDL